MERLHRREHDEVHTIAYRLSVGVSFASDRRRVGSIDESEKKSMKGQLRCSPRSVIRGRRRCHSSRHVTTTAASTVLLVGSTGIISPTSSHRCYVSLSPKRGSECGTFSHLVRAGTTTMKPRHSTALRPITLIRRTPTPTLHPTLILVEAFLLVSDEYPHTVLPPHAMEAVPRYSARLVPGGPNRLVPGQGMARAEDNLRKWTGMRSDGYPNY